METRNGIVAIVILSCCIYSSALQWNKVQENNQPTLQDSWYPSSSRWQGYQQNNQEQNNFNRNPPSDSRTQRYPPNSNTNNDRAQNTENSNFYPPPVANPVQQFSDNRHYAQNQQSANPSNPHSSNSQSNNGHNIDYQNTGNDYSAFQSGSYNDRPTGNNQGPGQVTNFVPNPPSNLLDSLPRLSLHDDTNGSPNLHVDMPFLSSQVITGTGSVQDDQMGPINYLTKERAPGYNAQVPGESNNNSNNNRKHIVHPAEVVVRGDPNKDDTLGVKVSTPDKVYDVNLERLSSNILHEDVRFLTVSVDENGRTVFQEQFKTVDLQAKAREINYFHDLQTGTFLSVQAFRKNTGEKPQNFIEGVLYDELIVAAPHHQKRHKRSLYRHKHSVYYKDSDSKGAFHFDSVEVPNFEDLVKGKEHVRVKRQFIPSAVGVPPRSSIPSRQTSGQTKPSSQGIPSSSQSQDRPLRIEPELLLFVDFALFREFEGDSNELLEYLLHFWHAVNWKYLTIALSGSWPVIDLKIREIGVFKEPNAQPFIESSRIRRGSKLFSLYDAMDSLQKWLIRYENALPIHDIAFLQTGENACRRVKNTAEVVPFNPPSILKSLRQGQATSADAQNEDECITGTAGVAYVRGACLSAPMLRGNAFNFGIGEASNSFNGVIIAAHEVGHLLGAYHDGEADAGMCSPKSGFIMSYTRDDSYKFSRFSECSVRSFQNFLRMDRAKCLLHRSSRDTLKFPTTFPGKFMSLRQQCLRFTGGPPCEEGPTQCEHLCCDDRKGEWRYTRSEPAVDGTECSSMKVCLNGQCVPLSTIGR